MASELHRSLFTSIQQGSDHIPHPDRLGHHIHLITVHPVFVLILQCQVAAVTGALEQLDDGLSPTRRPARIKSGLSPRRKPRHRKPMAVNSTTGSRMGSMPGKECEAKNVERASPKAAISPGAGRKLCQTGSRSPRHPSAPATCPGKPAADGHGRRRGRGGPHRPADSPGPQNGNNPARF